MERSVIPGFLRWLMPHNDNKSRNFELEGVG
ncbi:hypothetical protein BH24ACT3_BH24ACT3_17210 [soil metagenome]